MYFRRVIIVVSVLAFIVLSTTGCSRKSDTRQADQINTQQEESQEMVGSVQQTCPVSGNPIDEDLYVDYDGKRIFVSDSMCLEAMQNDPEKYLLKLKQMGEIPQPLK